MKFRPLYDRIIIERLKNEEKTASGIYIPEMAQEKQQRGKVVAVGKGRVNEKGEVLKLDVKVGDVVLFEKGWVEEIKIDGQEYAILKEENVIGVVEA